MMISLVEGAMTDRSGGGIKRWMGFTADSETPVEATVTNNSGALARIRELESQLTELRSRRDITSLSKEEFEILATETAMTLIRTAQKREAAATQSADRILSESKRSAQSAIETAENKARTILSGAEIKGRRLIEAAEGDASEVIRDAESRAEELIGTKRREAMAITSTARKEAEQMVAEAAGDVLSYRAWLAGVVAEAERLYKVQLQSLSAASSAIEQSRSRLDGAWEKLSAVSDAVERSVDGNGKPILTVRDESVAQSKSTSSRRSSVSRSKSGTKSKRTATKRSTTKRSTTKRSTTKRSRDKKK
jgi:vacuolar-type H+-ATPase subunit H